MRTSLQRRRLRVASWFSTCFQRGVSMSTFRTAFFCVVTVVLGVMVRDASSTQAPAASSSTAPRMISRDEVTRIIDNTRRIVSPNGVDERIKLRIGGIDPWLLIRGRDRRNQLGKASCRERVCQYVEFMVVADTLIKKT